MSCPSQCPPGQQQRNDHVATLAMRIARNARSRRHRDGTFGQHQLDAQTHDPLKDLTPPGAQMSCRHPAFSVRVPLFYDRRSKLRGVDAVEYRVVEATLPNGALVLVRAA